MSEYSYNPLIAGIEEIRRSWGWFLALGILFIILGMACITFDVTATFASVLIFGWMLLIGGVFALVQAFTVGHWSGFFLYLLSALFRGFTGYLLVRYPLVGAETLTLVLASFFIVGGLFRHRYRRAGDDTACTDAHFRHLVHWFRDWPGPRLRWHRDDRIRDRDTSRVTQNAGFSCRVNT
jgi:hypothetical protein